VPELHGFLTAVEAGTEALVREGLGPEALPETTIKVALALLSFPSWQAFRRQHLSAGDTVEAQLRLLSAAISTPARD
jgi:hypothetical protein